MALIHVNEKEKPRCKLSYKPLKEEYVYDPLIEVSPYPTLNKLKYYLDRIHHCVTVVGIWVFKSDFPFGITLTKENLDFCCINDNETKAVNCYK